MYEKTFVTLTERFFKGVPWPPVELLAVLVDHDHVFCMLYKVPHEPEMIFKPTAVLALTLTATLSLGLNLALANAESQATTTPCLLLRAL